MEDVINEFVEIEDQLTALYQRKNELIKRCVTEFGADQPLIKANEGG